MNLVEKILGDVGVLDKQIINPETDRKIKVSTALGYDKNEPVYKKATQLVKKSAGKEEPKSNKATSEKTPVKTAVQKKKSERSHKPKSASYGISKEAVAFLNEKGLSGLNVYPQSFVTLDQIKLNPEIESKGKDNVWVAKFPFKLPNGKEAVKIAYTRGFMKKSQVEKYKKISKISTKDIQNLESKTNALLSNPNKSISDSACILGIILRTGLRVGSDNNPTTGNLGVRTLKKENIKVNGDTVNFKFIGKSYQENIATIKDKLIADYLSKNLADKKDTDNAFSASYEMVGRVMDKINPKKINPKDLRTYKATEMAKQFLQDKSLGIPPPLPKDDKEIKKVVKEKLAKVFEKVAEFLNNTPAMAKNSYVHPVVITDFLTSLNLEPKQVGYKHITMEADNKKGIQFTTMDEMFAKYKNYGEGEEAEASEIDLDDMYDCEEYLLPDWWFDDNIDLVRKK